MKTRQIILEFIKEYFEKHCYAPSYEEIMEKTGLKSKATVNRHISKLFESGDLETDFDDGVARKRAFRPKGYICRKEEDERPDQE